MSLSDMSLSFLQDGDSPSYNIKFGYESLALHKWSTKCQYDEFVQLLGPGMNVHLQQNFLLRDIFNLGSPLLAEEMCKPKSSKLERVSIKNLLIHIAIVVIYSLTHDIIYFLT